MGLKQTYVDNNTGLSITDAYYKIMRVDIINEQRVCLLLGAYTAKKQAQPIKVSEHNLHVSQDVAEGETPVTPFADNFSIAAMDAVDANLIKNAYNYLKTLPEFADAEDVLES